MVGNNNYKESAVDKVVKRVNNKEREKNRNENERDDNYFGALTYNIYRMRYRKNIKTNLRNMEQKQRLKGGEQCLTLYIWPYK